ncbi:hypothetical protein [Singulisphaera sp. PoT]|uniref:hypothetical protein n=1 Tax=Singulisphaera sp. PoT TaxID=3411797 RepID=UPI003BF4B94B
MPEREPPPTGLRQILQRPGARKRVGSAVASLMGAGLVAILAIGVLVIWHAIRRANLVRERLGPPRIAGLLEFEDRPAMTESDAPSPEPRKSEPS